MARMGRHDGDIDVLAKIVKEAEEAFEGEVFKVAAEKQGDFRLADFENFGRLGLGEFLLFDDRLNFEDNFRFSKSLFRVVDSEISKYIARAFCVFDVAEAFCFEFWLFHTFILL